MWPFSGRKKKPAPGRPELRQFAALSADDFARHPVWVGCHTADYHEEWYEDTDEETFRPWTGSLPVGADEMYLIRCTYSFADGTTMSGFATPAESEDEWGRIQPQIFSPSGARLGVWLGMFAEGGELERFCSAFCRKKEDIFPASFAPVAGLTSACCSGTIRGLMKMSGDSYEVVEK